MIAHVSGVVKEKSGTSVIIDVHGIGYEVSVASGDYERLLVNDDAMLYTYHHIREQSQELFGFSHLSAKKLFQLLITVQGVGPKAALAILSLGESDIVRSAIGNGDAAFIAKASGVGKKTAERVVVDLSDKVGTVLLADNNTVTGTTQVLAHDDALEALMALGYTLSDASQALEGVSTELSTADRVTQALKG